ncbi:hypothetical protein GQ457_06G044200 [Hibiscus cannabinus]
MASSEADSRMSQVVAPALEKIIKNASWRKHSKLAHQCKSLLEKLTTKSPLFPSDSEPDNSIPVHSMTAPLINACATAFNKIVEPAVDCIQKLIAYSYLRGEADTTGGPEAQLLSKLIESVCKCHDSGDDAVELLVLKTLFSVVTSISLRIHGDCLLLIVRTCYDIYLGSKNVVNQTTAKASLVQMGHDGAFETTAVQTTNPTDLLNSTDKDMLDAKYWEISMYKTALEGRKGEWPMVKWREMMIWRALCKLSMKTPPKEALAEPHLMRGKIVALELLKILLENAGAVFRTSESFLLAVQFFLGAIKQYLCLSLLKNSASSLIIVFQLLAPFSLVWCQDLGRYLSHYDCDVNSSNIFERYNVNGLLKTAQGVPSGTATTLLPPQEATMKLEAMNCLVAI